MAKTFMGSVALTAKHGFLSLEAGSDFDAKTETGELIQHLLDMAKVYKMRINAFAPEVDGGTKTGWATTYSVAQVEKILAAGRVPVIFQSAKARFPAPYLALIVPTQRAIPTKAKTGPDLSRKAKATTPEPEAPKAPALGRKR
jgi:hypothetical protein